MTNYTPFPLLFLAAAAPLAADLRPLSTDRPDATESPHTVDAGHFQFEMELAAWARDGRERELSLGELNAKFGLDNSTDLQLVLPFYTHVRGGDEGFGDVQIRLKHNTGLTWLATPVWQFDGGVRVGLTSASTDFTPFFGVSTKF